MIVITGAIRDTSRKKLYQELGLESLKDRNGWDDFVICIRFYPQNLPPIISCQNYVSFRTALMNELSSICI